jgi:glycosyltransferase involved in cell wall biosynthesis
VVFSGGKFEDRKGQDVAIKAYKVLQDRYPDVRLVTAWANAYTNNNGTQALQNAKIDMNRVIQVPLALNFVMAEVYQNTDIGLFPSRCEAGTNLVMMEYMACGKPAIASKLTGQGDLLNNHNSLHIASKGTCKLVDENGIHLADWEDPCVDSLVEHLDWSYNNRDNLDPIGDEAAKTMLNKTWGHMASSIIKLIG